jgi:RecA/RadA recombinase
VSSNTQFMRLAERLRQEYETRFFRRLRDVTKPNERKVTTGYPELDTALQIGGLPRGCITEICRTQTSGGGTFALQLLAAAQRRGEVVAYVDCPTLFDADYAFHCGVEIDAVTFVRPQTLAVALSIAATLVLHGNVNLLVVADLPALCHSGEWAHTLGMGMRRLHPALQKSRAVALFLTDEASVGLLTHDTAVRLELARQRWLRRRGNVVGVQTRVTITRNKFGRTPQGATLQIRFPDDHL